MPPPTTRMSGLDFEGMVPRRDVGPDPGSCRVSAQLRLTKQRPPRALVKAPPPIGGGAAAAIAKVENGPFPAPAPKQLEP
jgi:hypothetical protein